MRIDKHSTPTTIERSFGDIPALTTIIPQADHHAGAYFAQSSAHPELYAHMPLGPYASEDDFVSCFLEKRVYPDPRFIALAIIDKTRPSSAEDDEGELAGMMAFMETSTTHLSTEIGCVVVLPSYHRSHVTTNAVGLMLQYALNSVEEGGLGLRRVKWQASTMNAPSIRVAERLGFQKEGILRWHFAFRQGAQNRKVGNGRALPPGSAEGDLGRDTVVLSLCWDDWAQGGKTKVEEAMARVR